MPSCRALYGIPHARRWLALGRGRATSNSRAALGGKGKALKNELAYGASSPSGLRLPAGLENYLTSEPLAHHLTYLKPITVALPLLIVVAHDLLR